MRSDAARPDRPWALPCLLAAAGFAFDLVAWWPGQMSFDSAYAWWQARGGTGSDIVPPGFMFAWRACLALADGPGMLFGLHLTLFWCGLALFARSLSRSGIATAALMLLAGFAPVSLLLRGHAWTDVALFSALVFVSGALASARADGRRGWLAAALPALLYAAVVRHNALPAVLPFCAWWSWIALGGARGKVARAPLASATAALVLLAIGTPRLLATQVERHVPLWPLAAEYDLVAVSIATDRMRLPDFMYGPGLDVQELRAAFREWSALPMLTGTRHGLRQAFEPPLDAVELAQLKRAWFDAVVDEPMAWLRHRARVSRALFGTHARDWPRGLVYEDSEATFGDNPPVAPNAGVLHAALMRLADGAASTAWLAAWPCLALGLFALPLAWRWRRTMRSDAALLLLASAWLYALPLCALTASAELRYLGWPCVASLLAFGCMVFGAGASASAEQAAVRA
jgi:hypothetical protein